MTTLPKRATRWPFRLKTLADLRELCDEWKVKVEADEDLSVLSQPVGAGSLWAPNAMGIHPMEGCDGQSDGSPGELTIRRYDRFSTGGAGLVWVEAIAVVPEGRANPRQLWIHEGNVTNFKTLLARMRDQAARKFGSAHRPLLVAQLTHSGRYSKPVDQRRPLIAQHDPYRDAKMKLAADWPVVTDEYLDSLPQKFVQAARLAFEAGFDALDIKACHGYLINELFGSRTREGRYGGSFENRTRLFLDIIDRIRRQLGADQALVTRLGVYDAVAHPYGWGVDRDDYTKPDLSEPLRLVGELARRGMPMINITIANPYYNPHYGRPYNQPAMGMYESPEHPIIGVERMLSLAAQVQRAYPQVAMVATGFSWLQTLMPHVMASMLRRGRAKFVGAGRMAFAYPDFAADIMFKGRLDPKRVCIACSACTQIMRDGGMTGCVIRDAAVYGPIHRQGPQHGPKTNP